MDEVEPASVVLLLWENSEDFKRMKRQQSVLLHLEAKPWAHI